MRKQQAMSLIELIVYMALAVLAGVLLWAFQNITKSTQRASTASYLVSGETETCLDWIRRDINETALASIQVYPSTGAATEAPGMSFVSNRSFADSKPLVNSWGAPQWDKHVFYTLDFTAGEQTGNLVRWEREIANKNLLPVLSELLPSNAAQDKQRVVLREVLAPNQTVSGVGSGGELVSDEFGGFRSQFVRRAGSSGGAETLTTINPTAGHARDNTRLLEFELKILQEGKNYYSLGFRAAAQH